MADHDELGETQVATEAPSRDSISLPPMFVAGGARYEREVLLGRGGMGIVELHLDRRIGRRVAMKILRSDMIDDVAQRRFLREAQLQGQLEHPAIVPVYDLGEGADGAVYFTMKRIRGITLHEVIQGLARGDFDADKYGRRRLLTAFSQVCLAIDFAHSRGVIHRDLKPANIMLGDFGEVYVLDWGIARVETAAEGEPIAHAPLAPVGAPPTQAGTTIGTPGYMPPEQLRGEAVTSAVDIYALGAILFELLSLEPLHRRGRFEAIVASTIEPGDLRPSARRPDAEIPPELDAACVQALAASADERFARARELHDAVERYLDGERDLAARRLQAAAHATAVTAIREATHASPVAELAARRQAMKEIGRALALDPDNVAVLEAMRDLLTQDPRMTPPEVEGALALGERERLGKVAKFGAIVYLGMWLFLPLWLWMGVLDATPLATMYGAFTAAGLTSIAVWRHSQRRPWMALVPMVLSNIGLVAGAWMVGPFILVPTAAVVNTTAYAIHVSRRYRLAVFVGGLLSFVVPLVLELVGVVGSSFAAGEGGFLLLPRALDLAPGPTVAVIAVVQIVAIVLASVVIGIIRDYVDAAERKTYTYAWHLREFIPDGHKRRTDPIHRLDDDA